MFVEDDFIAISALQHYMFCPRQCGLIHVDDVWQDNALTARGELLHEKVDTDTYETRGTLKTVRGLRVHSSRLGIVGRADVVEFRQPKSPDGPDEVIPVEFKAGKPKKDATDKVQLCAQALCLEEMLHSTVSRGALFYGRIRRREQVEIDNALRSQTETVIRAVRTIVTTQKLPAARYASKCRSCSLESVCQPKAMNGRRIETYIKALYTP